MFEIVCLYDLSFIQSYLGSKVLTSTRKDFQLHL